MSILELFNGQLSLEEILNCDLAFLRELCSARAKLLEEQQKAKNEAMEQAMAENNSKKSSY